MNCEINSSKFTFQGLSLLIPLLIPLLILFLLLPEQNSLCADEIYLKEGPKLWQGEVSLGYNKSSGNTQTSQLALGLYGNRKTEHDEFTFKGDSFYSSSNKKMDTQRHSGMLRYAFSFWERKWYNFYKIQGEHDRFANIDYRLIPSTGIGYWRFDRPDLKLMFEIGAGFERTDFRNNTETTNKAVLVPRMFFEKRLFAKSRLSQDIFFYPSLGDKGEFRVHSETAFTNPINSQMSLRLSLIDDYNARPPKDTKKNDVRLISSILYNF